MSFNYTEKPLFEDRTEAGRKLADRLAKYLAPDTLIQAIPRGGIPVALEVAKNSDSLFDVSICRKIPFPYNKEAGYGAVSEGGLVILNSELVAEIGFDEPQIENQVSSVRAEIIKTSALYRQVIKKVPESGKVVIIIDDGLASGYSMAAALQSARLKNPSRVIVASPVASSSAYRLLEPLSDDIVTIATGRSIPFGVASYYNHWHDLDDGEVMEFLNDWNKNRKNALPQK